MRAPAPPPHAVSYPWGMATRKLVLDVAGREVTVSNPDKVYFPRTGHTKLDLVNYYLAVADGALRGVAERPMALKRFVNGAEGEFFFQKRAPEKRPEWVGRFCFVQVAAPTRGALEDTGLSKKDAERAKNMFALGLLSWMYHRPHEGTERFLREKFARRPDLAEANVLAFRAGHAFGETTIEEAPERVATVSWVNHDVATALGVVPVGVPALDFGANENGSTDWFDAALEEMQGVRVDIVVVKRHARSVKQDRIAGAAPSGVRHRGIDIGPSVQEQVEPRAPLAIGVITHPPI